MPRETPVEAIELIKAGRKHAARALLLAILDVEPDNIEAWLWLTACAINQEEYSRALREALRLDPTHPEARELTLKLARETIKQHTGRDFVAERGEARQRSFQGVLFGVFVLLLLGVVVLAGLRVLDIDLVAEIAPSPVPTISNQELCQNDLAAIQQAVVARCGGLENGQACLMNGNFHFERAGESVGNFTLAGDRMRLQDLESLQAEPYQLGGVSWGLAWLRGELGRGGSVNALLIGGASIQGVDSQLTDFTLLTGNQNTLCDGVPPSGLLLQSPQQIHFDVNDWQVDMLGSAFIEAAAGGIMRYTQLDGIAEMVIVDQTYRLTAGEGVQISIDRSGHPVGVSELQNPSNPYLSRTEQIALADMARVANFETPWHESEAVAEVVGEATPQDEAFADLLVGMGSDVIAFSSDRYGSSDIFLVDGVGRIKRLIDDPASDTDPAISPDGSRITFSSNRNGNQDIYVLDLTTGDISQLTLNQGENTHPSWTGNQIIFTSTRSGSPQIWLMGLDNSTPQMLTDIENGVFMGRMSVNGVLAYSLIDEGIVIYEDGDITILDDDRATWLAWSPDGTQLAYQSTQTGGSHVYIYDLATGNTRRLTMQSISGEASPVWNPAGTHIAFVSWRAYEADLFIANVETGRIETRAVGGVLVPEWGTVTTAQTTPALTPSGIWQPISGGISSTLYDIDMLSAAYGLAVGANNTILRYADGIWGRMDMTPIQTAYGGERLTFYGVEATSVSTAWAVGERGAIIHLQNGRWEAMPSPVKSTLYDVGGGWIVGADGVILQLQPDGMTWESIESPTREILYAIYLMPDLSFVGENSTVLKSQAGGIWGKQLSLSEWDTVDLLNGGHGHFYRLARLEGQSMWAVGRDGLILYSNGEVWTRLPNVVYTDLYGVDFGANNDGWAVGEHGTLLHYTPIPEPQASPLPPLAANVDDPQAILKNWSCDILQGTLFYQYDIVLEPLSNDGTLLATGFLPDFGVVLLDGVFNESSDEEGMISQLTLTETEVIEGNSNYRADGTLILRLRADGQIVGSVYADDILVGEIVGCQERR